MDPSQKTCFTRIRTTTANAIPESLKTFYNNFLFPAGKKTANFSKKYIFPKALNTLKDKYLPLSTSGDWYNKKELSKKEIVRLKTLIAHTQNQIEELETHKVSQRPLNKRFSKQRATLNTKGKLTTEEILAQLEKIDLEFHKKLEIAEKYNSHLDIIWLSEATARLGGWAGWIATEAMAYFPLGLAIGSELIPKNISAFIPNPTEFAVNRCIQAIAIAIHLKDAINLTSTTLKEISIVEVRKRILCTVASISYMIAMHHLKQNLDLSSLPIWYCITEPSNSTLLSNVTSL